MNIQGFDFNLTCSGCPEQYEVFLNGEQMAYFRLRHGYFYAAVPNHGGEVVYDAEPKGDGIFEWNEREEYLRLALDAVIQHYYTLGEIIKAGCHNCKSVRWTHPNKTHIRCIECSPDHDRFHYPIPNSNISDKI